MIGHKETFAIEVSSQLCFMASCLS